MEATKITTPQTRLSSLETIQSLFLDTDLSALLLNYLGRAMYLWGDGESTFVSIHKHKTTTHRRRDGQTGRRSFCGHKASRQSVASHSEFFIPQLHSHIMYIRTYGMVESYVHVHHSMHGNVVARNSLTIYFSASAGVSDFI